MKVEIDLNDILGDEYGTETLQESVRRQVIDNLTHKLNDGIGKRVDQEVAQVINDEIRVAVQAQMPSIINDLINTEYFTVDRYGHRSSEKTTFREQLVKAIHEHMRYEKKQWESEKNAFTKAVDQIVEQNVNSFRAEFGKQVDAQFVKEAMEYATKKLTERLGVKAA